MIVKLSQTASNIKQQYNVTGNNFNYQGQAGSFSKLQPIILHNNRTTLKGTYTLSNLLNYIPLRYLFNKQNLTRQFSLYRNNKKYGCIAFSKHGWLKSCYVITLDNGNTFKCYCCSRGSFDYVSIYQGDTQIALVETHLKAIDYKYTHKLYILDNYKHFADTFSFFVLYYASYTFAKRFHMSKTIVNQKAWSLSKYNAKYDPNWRETHFPNEDYFEKATPTTKRYGDI